MRFISSALMIAFLICAPVITGCEAEKKKDPSAQPVTSPDKKKNPRGLQAPPVPDAPP
jgi:hypothetical protein